MATTTTTSTATTTTISGPTPTAPTSMPPLLDPLPSASPANPSIPRHTHLFGYPISHSLSPTLHTSIYSTLSLPWTYTLAPSATLASVLPLLHTPGFAGAAVTMPHKTAIIEHLDFVTKDAAAVGGVNTVIVREVAGRRVLVGGNTDWIGIRSALGDAGKEGWGEALVVGAGATARAACWTLWNMGVRKVWVVNREESEISALITHFDGLCLDGFEVAALPEKTEVARIGTVVACVPDFPPVTVEEKKVRQQLWTVLEGGTRRGGVLLDLCYKPRVTTTLMKGAEEGWRCVDGLEVVIEQGIAQQVVWTGRKKEEMGVEEAAEKVRQKEDGVMVKL